MLRKGIVAKKHVYPEDVIVHGLKKDKRVQRIVKEVLDNIRKKGHDDVIQCTEGIVLRSKKLFRGKHDNTYAFVRRFSAGNRKAGVWPTYRVTLIRENIQKLSDYDLKQTVAHELTHIWLYLASYSRSDIVEEIVIEYLTNFLWGYRTNKKKSAYLKQLKPIRIRKVKTPIQ